MHNNPDKMQQFAEYMAKMTQKFAKTSKQMHDMSLEFLKLISPPERLERSQRGRNKNKQKQKAEDLNSNLVDGDQEQINGLSPRKKLKTHNRIEQAEEDIEEQVIIEKPAPKSTKKTEEKHEKKGQPETDDSKKKQKVISHKPKAPTSSFLLFFKQQQHSIAKSYPNYGVVELTKVAAKCWNELSVQQKQPYQKLFEGERKKYQQQMQKYRREFPEQVKLKQLQKKQKKKKKAKQRRQKQAKQPKQIKEKYIPIVSNNDPNIYHQITPMGNNLVKLQYRAGNQQKQQKQRFDQNELKQQLINQEQLQSGDALNSQEQNSLGEDI